LAYLQWLNKTKNQETKKQEKQQKQNDKTQLSATTPTLGCAILFFLFLFLVSCFFCFFGLCFSGSLLFFLKGWQNNTKVKDLDLTLRQFSHFKDCKLAFDCFIVCFGHVVPLEKHE
jgi:hypothetical protein